MASILSDVYSILEFDYILAYSADDVSPRAIADASSAIENLVLCDQVLIESQQAYRWVGSSLDSFPDVLSPVIQIGEADPSVDSVLRALREVPPSDSYRGQQGRSGFEIRALLYLQLASQLGVYYAPHKERADLLKGEQGQNAVRAAAFSIEVFDKKMAESFPMDLASVDLSIPPVVDYVCAMSRRRRCSLAEAVNEVRHSKNAMEFRQWCGLIDQELMQAKGRSRVGVLQEVLEEVRAAAESWSRDLRVDHDYKKRVISLRKALGIGGPIWARVGSLLASLGLDKVEIKDPVIQPERPHLLFLNDIYANH